MDLQIKTEKCLPKNYCSCNKMNLNTIFYTKKYKTYQLNKHKKMQVKTKN